MLIEQLEKMGLIETGKINLTMHQFNISTDIKFIGRVFTLVYLHL